MECLRDLEVLDAPGGVEAAVLLLQQPAVEEHANRLHGVQRDPFRTLEDPLPQLVRETRHEPAHELLHRRGRQRLEVQRGEVPFARAPGRPSIGELRPGEREDEHRVVLRPFEEVFDEVEEGAVGPLQILEDEGHRVGLGDAFEEQPPRGEQIGLVSGGPLLEPEEV